MPFISQKTGRNKKSKDGGDAAFYNGFIYALKGGNTCEFYRYNIATNSWTELDPMPDFGSTGKKRRVKQGGALACADGSFYAFKGGKTREFWLYIPYSGEGQFQFAGIPVEPEKEGGVDGGENPIVDGIDAYCPRFRPDGNAVCYTREDTAGNLQVFMALRNLPNQEIQLTFEPTEHNSPVFDPSGTWVAMSMEDSNGCCQIAKVLAGANPGPSIILTTGDEDAEFPEWSPSGNHIVFQRYDPSTGYIQLFRIASNGGEAEQLTSDAADHELPVYLNPDEIVFQRYPDEDYIQIYKLNLLTGQMTPLTAGENDHENPAPSYDGTRVAYQVMDNTGTYQIGVVSATGGDERVLTSETAYDLEAPDFSPDNSSIFSVRWLGLTSQIGVVDALAGGFVPLTDGSAIRDNPDSYYETSSQTNYVVYERELITGSGSYRGKPGRKGGTGIYLTLFKRKKEGTMAQGTLSLRLEQILPNPAREGVKIRYCVPEETDISLKVYNCAGQLVKVLYSGRAKPGAYTEMWNRRDTKGRRVGAGVYFLYLETPLRRLKQKLVLSE